MTEATRFTLLLMALTLATSSHVLSQGTSTRAVADSCLSTSEFQLHGIFLATDTTGTLRTPGKVLRVKTDSGADDGGWFERRTYFYRDMEMAVVRGAVDRLATRTHNLATPSGLSAGLDLQSVRRILLKQGVTFRSGTDTVDIGDCESSGGEYITLVFDRSQRIRSLEIFAARP